MTQLTIYDEDHKALTEAAALLGDTVEEIVGYLVTEHLPELIEDLRDAHYNNL